MTDTIPCFKCEEPMQRAFEGGYELQPDAGLHFDTGGAYGSTVFDPMDGSSLNILICDDCIVEAARKGHVLLDQKTVGIGFNPSFGDEPPAVFPAGFHVPDRPPIPWDPWDPDQRYEQQEPLMVEPEDVAEAKELHSTVMWKASAVAFAREWLEAEKEREGEAQ